MYNHYYNHKNQKCKLILLDEVAHFLTPTVADLAGRDNPRFVTLPVHSLDHNPIGWYQLQLQDALSTDSSSHDELTVAIDTVLD